MADVDMDDDDRCNLAAALIQTRWREYLARKAAYGGDDYSSPALGSDGSPQNELTEEEQKEQLLAHLRSLIVEREALISQNLNQQRWLATKGPIADKRQSAAQDVTGALNSDPSSEAEAKYWETIQGIHEQRQAMEMKKQDAEDELHLARHKHESVVDEAADEEERFRLYIKEKALESIFPRNGKPIPMKTLQRWEEEEQAMYSELHNARVNYIKQRNKSKRLTAQLKVKEQLNDGLHLIDFEQLKIENTNLNEKIEERNEDLLKLRKKATTTIHILTHVKEKLEFVKAENVQLHKQVKSLDEKLDEVRTTLGNRKKDRDVFVNENLRMKEKMPMIGSEDLLLDFELRKNEIESLRQEVVMLTNAHHELMGWIGEHQGQLEKLQRAAAKAA